MTLRTKSRGRQWLVWGGLALVALAVAAVWSFLATGSVSLGYFRPLGNRLALPFFALFAYLAWEMRWDGIRREKGKGKREQGEEKVRVEGRGQDVVEKVGGGGDRNLTTESVDQHGRARTPSAPQSSSNAVSLRNDCGGPGVSAPPQQNESDAKRHVHSTPTPNTYASVSSSSDDATGEALFAQARTLRHRKIPDFNKDAEYLDLLGKSAAVGYAPALAKLGEYAMRRAAWVEAYYWMSMAKRQGMQGLANVMREIRKNWALDDFPDQNSNVNRLFTLDAGSIGRALLHVDSGHEAAKAREFLKATHPDFLP